MSCGAYHSVILTEDGKAWVWGDNQHGQLGIVSSITNHPPFPQLLHLPKSPFPKIRFSKVICGWHHTVAFSENGSCFVWGMNKYGQLGLGDKHNRYEPTLLKRETPFISIVCGRFHTIGLSIDRKCYSWGSNESGQLGVSRSIWSHSDSPIEVFFLQSISKFVIKEIYCGALHSLLLTFDNQCIGWGDNTHGQIGLNNTASSLPFVENPVLIPFKIPFASLACGAEHSVGISFQGECYVFGSNHFGQLGTGDFLDRIEPEKLEIPGKVIQVSCGKYHTAAIADSNKCYVWGNNFAGQLGIGYSRALQPCLLAYGPKFYSISCGKFHCVTVTNKGAYAWGYNGFTKRQLYQVDVNSKFAFIPGYNWYEDYIARNILVLGRLLFSDTGFLFGRVPYPLIKEIICLVFDEYHILSPNFLEEIFQYSQNKQLLKRVIYYDFFQNPGIRTMQSLLQAIKQYDISSNQESTISVSEEIHLKHRRIIKRKKKKSPNSPEASSHSIIHTQQSTKDSILRKNPTNSTFCFSITNNAEVFLYLLLCFLILFICFINY